MEPIRDPNCSLCNGTGVSPGSEGEDWSDNSGKHRFALSYPHRGLQCPWCYGVHMQKKLREQDEALLKIVRRAFPKEPNENNL